MSGRDESYDAVVVGSGPNGLTAAATLAARGKRVLVIEAADTPGGAAASAALTIPGFIHDVGSTIHALAAASPAFRELGLRARGLEFIDFPILLAHVLDDSAGASMYKSIDRTADGLGVDGSRYRRLMAPIVENFDQLTPMVLKPLLSWPRHPLLMARFGARALAPITMICALFKTEKAKALLAGNAAHSFVPLHHPVTTAFALMLQASGHAHGWPVAAGGSVAITRALVAVIESHGGVIETNSKVTSREQLPEHKALLLDTTPAAAALILAGSQSSLRKRRYCRYRRAPGAFKIDYALSSPIPWDFQDARSAGTVHVCGNYGAVAAAERATAAGEMPPRPFLLVTQATLADPSRAPEGAHTAWVYAHVPNGFGGDARPAIETQLERFAPGFRKTIIDACVLPPHALQAHNMNLVGGDVAGGSYSGLQSIRRPILSPHPYRTGASGAYLCSASTPPGAGAHGMCGYNAALDVLTRELR